MWALVFGMDRHEDGGGGGDDRDEEDEDGRAGATHAAGAQVGGCLELDCAGAAWWWQWWVAVVVVSQGRWTNLAGRSAPHIGRASS